LSAALKSRLFFFRDGQRTAVVLFEEQGRAVLVEELGEMGRDLASAISLGGFVRGKTGSPSKTAH
jgi:hypothetical protein